MKKLRKIAAVLAIFTFTLNASSCGQVDESETKGESLSISENKESSESDISEETENSEENKSKSDSSISKTSSTAPTSGAEVSKSDSQKVTIYGREESNTASSSSGKSSAASLASPSNNSSISGNNSSANKTNNSSQKNESSKAENPSENLASPVETPTEESSDEKVYTATISLGDTPQLIGGNVSNDGTKILISGGGDYFISGSVADGQIEVNTTEKVKIYLNGVSISNSTGPAIQITDAKRATMVLVEGTTSELSDGGNDKVNDGVIFSNDTIEIKGKGTMNITAQNAHGIASDDDIVIENGNINITSIKSGLIAHDDITINGGNLNIQGGTNGIKSKGTINVNGGHSIISGGTKEEKSSVYADGPFYYTGGYLFAAGNRVTAPSESVNPYVVAGFNESKSAENYITLYLNGEEAASFNSYNSFKCIMMLSPDIYTGSSFGLNVGENYYGEYSVSDIHNIFSIE